MRSLTVDEARERAALLRVVAMDLDLDLTRGERTFGSRTTIDVEALADGETFLDVRPDALLAIDVDGAALDPAALDDGRVPLRLTAGRHRVTVDAEMAYSHDGEGLHRTVDPADDLAYTYLMSFLDAAPRCFACFDQPDLKAPYRVRVSAPADWTVVGNGRATRVDGSESDDTARWELAETPALATYFVTLVAGPYHSRYAEHDGIRLGVHAKQSLAAALDKEVDEIVEVTGQALDRFHELFGIRYPFGDYDQAFVPEFNAGAMENPGCVTFRDSLMFRGPVTTGERSFRAEIVVHEMAHMWFGDLVTMRWWDDLWLNESFADYMGYRVTTEATRFTDLWVEAVFRRKYWGLRADQQPSTHPIAGNGAVDANTALQDFDGISYAKGAAVLKQLAAWLGDDTFLAGVRDHLASRSFGNATLADLLGSWERAGAHDLQAWAEAWLREAGPDTLRVEGDTLHRLPPPGSAASARPHGVTVLRIGPDGTVEEAPLSISADSTTLPLAPASGHLLVPDGRDQTWAKVRLDPETLRLLPERLASVPDAVTRGSVWLAVRDAFEDAELTPEAALELLVAALPHEDTDVGLAALTTFAVEDVLGRAMGGDVDAARRVERALQQRLASAAPSSSLQLASARAYVRVCTDPDALGGWLAEGAPEGLVMDADMRWRVLLQRCRWGADDASRIDEEYVRDRTNDGEAHAARCRAALPDPGAKAAAWELVTHDADASNHVLYAACEGFWWPEQSTLTDPYVDRYFTDVPATAALRVGWVVAESAALVYPRFAVREETAVAADRLLAAPGVDAAVRRRIAEGTADLRRALAIRARRPSGQSQPG